MGFFLDGPMISEATHDRRDGFGLRRTAYIVFRANDGSALGHFGRAGIAVTVAASLLGHGYYYDNPRSRKAGMALIVALLASAAVTELVRYSVQLPRPKQSSGYGFPSGHTSAAFSLAAVLGITFPQAGSLFYLVALLTGISRLYFRAHYLIDVLGGALIGVLIPWSSLGKEADYSFLPSERHFSRISRLAHDFAYWRRSSRIFLCHRAKYFHTQIDVR